MSRATGRRSQVFGGAWAAVAGAVLLSSVGITQANAEAPLLTGPDAQALSAVLISDDTRDIPVSSNELIVPLAQPLLGDPAPSVLADDDDVIVDVPDAALAAALRERFGQEDITRGKLRGLTFLNLNNLPVADLTGLEYATRLGDFEMKNTSVVSLEPLRNLESLSYFFAGNSPVESIEPFRGMRKLNYVSLNATGVTDLSPLDGAPALVRLEIASTAVSSLAPLRNSPLLREVYFQETLVSDLSPLAELRELRTISGPQARISDLTPIAGLPELSLLNVNQNSIADISMFETWPKLQQVGFSGQRLTQPAVYPSASESTFRKTDAAAAFRMPNDELVEVGSGADQLPGGGALWSGITPDTTELEAEFTHRIGGDGPRYSATVTYPVVFADFAAAPGQGTTVATSEEAEVSLDFRTVPEFSGGEYQLLGDAVPGLTLGQDGMLTGALAHAGDYAVSVELTDRHGNRITRSFTISVSAATEPTEEPEDEDNGGSGTATPVTGSKDAVAATGGADLTGVAVSGLALLALGGAAAWGARRRATR